MTTQDYIKEGLEELWCAVAACGLFAGFLAIVLVVTS